MACGVDTGLAGATKASSRKLCEKFHREFDTFWSNVGIRWRPIGTRDDIVRAVCPKL